MNINELFNDLPEVNFIDVDTEKDEQNIISVYEAITNSVLYPADPVRLFLSTLAAVISQLKAQVNFTGQQNLLRYSQGQYLDHLGALLGVYRLKEAAASADFIFILQQKNSFDTVIPKGTRITKDGKYYFATDTDIRIKAGNLSAHGLATCLSTGEQFNDLAVNEINKLVDPIAGIITVKNTTVTKGGASEERDFDFRNRIALAPEKFSVAGPSLAYRYWALTAHQNIKDVSVSRLVPGTVLVSVLLNTGVPINREVTELQAVRNILNDEKIRPLNDTVIVESAVSVDVSFNMTWYIDKDKQGLLSQISSNIQTAVEEYKIWQTDKLQRDVVSDELVQRCKDAGAKRIVVTGLDFRKVSHNEVCQFVSTSVNYGGVDE